ncbi:biopolymer transporter ExbD [Leptolyngbya sp. FACHB-261]|uniref:ExbD/TolR family protein n=1 Tax=Leptolyngbya sp. FACHB-261 TaxID=2692806 RepID=UPI001687B4A0|nr:biopolymer transporter ExbD [Leptolyngbya sp. FACHB-261]MBD2104390.1 biopolymer transporter ExbD [Leptolyngbya sp. FACHB-261]
MRLTEEPESNPQINIVPMIDVVFAILTFFIMSTLFLTRSEGLPVNLPQASTAQMQKESQINITIDAVGKIALNRQPVELPQLRSKLQALMGTDTQSLVVLNADEQVANGKVVSVMDVVRTIPGARMAIAAKRPAP